ncbi:hypothetical protein BDP27DRAFT_1426438 [Rhodocollybia butyracea]|uniref:Uncharacterized protein n=1 Tax=Rhodocollybia butyracea TaxID=206335 RepID=A0A9P5PDX4_9AGAR|nr:hypothetical protein BDP27DRAFT_1426438 [Rhodocollybia butyracea]
MLSIVDLQTSTILPAQIVTKIARRIDKTLSCTMCLEHQASAELGVGIRILHIPEEFRGETYVNMGDLFELRRAGGTAAYFNGGFLSFEPVIIMIANEFIEQWYYEKIIAICRKMYGEEVAIAIKASFFASVLPEDNVNQQSTSVLTMVTNDKRLDMGMGIGNEVGNEVGEEEPEREPELEENRRGLPSTNAGAVGLGKGGSGGSGDEGGCKTSSSDWEASCVSLGPSRKGGFWVS